jgi:pimeloyl-ACP methyl ester carboxylesterase
MRANAVRPAESSRRRRKRWLVASAAALGLVVALVAGCSVLSPSFEPAVPPPPMVAKGVVGRTVEVEGGSIYLVGSEARAGTAVVFVHGSPGTWGAFRGWLMEPALVARAQLIAVDRPGFGGSDRGRAEPSLAVQARRIAAALAAVGVERAVLVGHSLGGPVIARIAVDHPQLAAGLLFIAPSIDPALEKRRWYNVFGAMRVVQWFLPVDWITSNREIWPLKSELER